MIILQNTFWCTVQRCHVHRGIYWHRPDKPLQALQQWGCRCCRQTQPVSSRSPGTRNIQQYACYWWHLPNAIVVILYCLIRNTAVIPSKITIISVSLFSAPQKPLIYNNIVTKNTHSTACTKLQYERRDSRRIEAMAAGMRCRKLLLPENKSSSLGRFQPAHTEPSPAPPGWRRYRQCLMVLLDLLPSW